MVCCPIYLMIGQYVVLLVSLVAFPNILIGAVAGADSDTPYCYDQLEGQFCFEERHACEVEQKNDLMADSVCYED